MNGRIKVLIVDDSAVVRQVLKRDLERDPAIDVVGVAADPFEARSIILKTPPDVITLDIEMPRMDGLTFLRKLMAQRPIATVVLSSLTPAGSRTAMEALAAGAVEVLAKPGGDYSVARLSADLIERIKIAAFARLSRSTEAPPPRPVPMSAVSGKLWALGASTGGVAALSDLIGRFPEHAPPTLIVQHMPPKFTASFAERLDKTCAVRVKEAADGDILVAGQVLVAPGGWHMTLRRTAGGYAVALNQEPARHGVRPAIDVLFNSIARIAGPETCAAVLTGMGSDGAAGLLAIREAGGRTIAQDEATSVVYGMPMEAARIGAAELVVPLREIAAALAAASMSNPAARAA